MTSRSPALAFERLGRRNLVVALIVAMVTVDAILIVLDLALGGSRDYPDRLRVAADRGLPEFFQYAKWIGAAVVAWSMRRLAPVYPVWAGVFVYLLVDDSVVLHERFGLVMSELLPGTLAFTDLLAPRSLFELGYQAVVSLIVLTAMWIALRRTTSAPARRFALGELALLILYGAFAVGGDVLQHLAGSSARVAEVVEDGGEMIVGSLLFGNFLLHAVENARQTIGDVSSPRT